MSTLVGGAAIALKSAVKSRNEAASAALAHSSPSRIDIKSKAAAAAAEGKEAKGKEAKGKESEACADKQFRRSVFVSYTEISLRQACLS